MWSNPDRPTTPRLFLTCRLTVRGSFLFRGWNVPTTPVLIVPEVFRQLTLAEWTGFSDAERAQVADHLADRLQAHGWAVEAPLLIETFGPASHPLPVLRWFEPVSGTPFSLVPGGTFRPGYAPEVLARFERIDRLLQAGDYEQVEEEDEEDEEVGPALPPLDALRAKEPVTVGPFLMTAELLHPDVPGLSRLLVKRPVRLLDVYQDSAQRSAGRLPIDLTWAETQKAVATFGWQIPTSAEFEWALRGGIEGVFYWGNRVPRWLAGEQGAEGFTEDELTDEIAWDDLMEVGFPQDRPRTWPWCNRLGLASLLPVGTWCDRSAEPNDNYPLIARGGAANCYPWQYCGEWHLFLTAYEARLPEEELAHPATNAVRPILRLQPDSAVRLV
jgi:hypothetical protein